MGAVYKRKRRSCGLCKPHKRGMADKMDRKQRVKFEEDVLEMSRGFAPELDEIEDMNITLFYDVFYGND